MTASPTSPSVTLTPTQRRALKAHAHHIEPVVIIGDAGLTPAVLREIDIHLKSHELIKIRVAGDDRAARVAMISTISEALAASAVQQIGTILVMFRQKPAEPSGKSSAGKVVHKPRARKAKRRTKRSYQGS
jgi:RNA-binding protein